MDDMVYYDGAYYFFQGRWMFRMAENHQPGYNALNTNQVYLLANFGIDFTIYAAYYDYNINQLIVVRKVGETSFQLEAITVHVLREGRVRLELDQDSDKVGLAEVYGDDTQHLYSAVMFNQTDGTDGTATLWMVMGTVTKENDRETKVRGVLDLLGILF